MDKGLPVGMYIGRSLPQVGDALWFFQSLHLPS